MNWVFLVCLIIIILLYIYVKRTSNPNDPMYHCEMYLDEDCPHVDGPLCDFPKCEMLKHYLEEEQ